MSSRWKNSLVLLVLIFLACVGLYLAPQSSISSSESPRPVERGPANPGLALWRLPETGAQQLYVLRVVDGDTYECAFLVPVMARLHGVNAPEKNTEAGKRVAALLASRLENNLLAAQLHGREKYGRLLADFRIDGRWLSEKLIADGLAKPWDGKGEKPQ